MWRCVVLVVVGIGCGGRRSPAPAAAPVEGASVAAEPAGCVLAIDTSGGIRVDGAPLADLRLETLERVLGPPDRTETVVSQQRYEEHGDEPWSTEVEVTDVHHVYDRLGLVVHTRNGAWEKDATPEQIRVFFANPRSFDHEAAPPVVPERRGACAVAINGVTIDPGADQRPPGATYQTEELELYGARFGTTSFTTIIDSLYTLDASPHLQLFLDAAATGRPSYLEIVPAPPP